MSSSITIRVAFNADQMNADAILQLLWNQGAVDFVHCETPLFTVRVSYDGELVSRMRYLNEDTAIGAFQERERTLQNTPDASGLVVQLIDPRENVVAETMIIRKGE